MLMNQCRYHCTCKDSFKHQVAILIFMAHIDCNQARYQYQNNKKTMDEQRLVMGQVKDTQPANSKIYC